MEDTRREGKNDDPIESSSGQSCILGHLMLRRKLMVTIRCIGEIDIRSSGMNSCRLQGEVMIDIQSESLYCQGHI